MLGEQLHDALAVRRFDDMRHEYFLAERGDVHFAAFGQAVGTLPFSLRNNRKLEGWIRLEPNETVTI